MCRHSIANVTLSCKYAVEVLKGQTRHVCGHYGCGGVLAALVIGRDLPLGKNCSLMCGPVYRGYKDELDAASSEEARWRPPGASSTSWLKSMRCGDAGSHQQAVATGPSVMVHGWIYD